LLIAMKYPPATHILLFASIATSTIRPGLAVPRPGPASKFVRHQQSRQQRKTEHDSQSSPPSPGLLVDGEGNLYSPRATKESVQRRPEVSLRGGDVCVDTEGNFYTPKAAASTLTSPSPSTSPLPTTITPAASTLSSFPHTSTLRGGSHNHNIGGLGVDSEGNFFATQEPGTPSCSKALFSRGGGLCVDNEGIFYTSRRQTVVAIDPKPTHSGSRRRLNDNNAVLLTKNKTHKKPKKPSDGAVPMTFIGYNNALMET